LFFFSFFLSFLYLHQGARGFSAKAMVVDEAEFVEESTFREVVLPILANAGAVLFVLSSPNRPGNYFETVLHQRDDEGNQEHMVVEVNLVCDACMKLPKERKAECTHKDYMRSAWHSASTEKAVRRIIGAGNESTALRELRGVHESDDFNVFDSDTLDFLFADSNFIDLHSQHFQRVYVACDPSGGGESRLAFTAIVAHGEFRVVRHTHHNHPHHTNYQTHNNNNQNPRKNASLSALNPSA
jgi:hypothetical protein